MKFNINYLAPFLLAANSLAWNHVTGPELGKQIANGQTLMIAYVLPDEKCSQALKQEWAALLKIKEDNIRGVSIDCSTEAELCSRDEVSSFPAIRLQQPDRGQIRYRGARKAASIQGFLRRTGRPTLSYVTDQNRTAFESLDDFVFIGRLISHDKAQQRHFETAAERYRDWYSFAISEADQTPELSCYNNLDGLQASTTMLDTPASFDAFIKQCTRPLIPQMTRRNELSFYGTQKSIVHYFVRNEKKREQYVKEMRPLAKRYMEYLHFVTIDVDEYADVAEMLGIGRGSEGLSVQNPNNGDIFPYTRKDNINAGSIEAFLGDIIGGKVKVWQPEALGHDEL